MNTRKTLIVVALVLVSSWLAPRNARAAPILWAGTTSSAWSDASNWTGAAVPNGYSVQATIGLSTNNPVTIGGGAADELEKLGGSTTALTIGTGSSGITADLEIANKGTLGMQGGIFITTPTSGLNKNRGIIIDTGGTLRNDGASGTTYSISGTTTSGHGVESLTLNGGTISSQNGGIWSFGPTVSVTGYGTISAQFTGSVTANGSGQTLHITNHLESISGASLHSNSGAILSLEGITVSGGTLTNTGVTALNGVTLNGVTNMSNAQLTGNSTLNTGAISSLLFNGYKLDVTGTVTNFSSIHVDAGTLNNAATSGTTTVGNSNFLYLTGGSITNNGGSTFVFGTNISGYGSVAGITSQTYGIMANGGTSSTPQTLTFDGGAGTALGTHSGSGVTMSSTAFTTLDLKGTFNIINPGIIAPDAGKVALDGATLNTYDPTGGVGGTPTTWNETVSSGAINVTKNSSMTGKFTSSATITINPGVKLDVNTGPLSNTSPMTNTGTVAVGSGTLNNSGSSDYTLAGGLAGKVTMAGGSITSGGGGGFTSTNNLSGFGTVTAPYTNNGKVIADGNGTGQTLAFTNAANGSPNTGGLGWFAQNTGKLALPTMNVAATSGSETYNWGGDPTSLGMVNSVGMNFSGVTGPGALSMALLSLDRADVHAGLINSIGVWDFAPNTLSFGTVDLTFRYDDAAALALGITDPSHQLHLFHWDGTDWDRLDATIAGNLLTSEGLTSLSDEYAIAQDVVPEPTTLAVWSLLGGLAVGFGWWRKRKAV